MVILLPIHALHIISDCDILFMSTKDTTGYQHMPDVKEWVEKNITPLINIQYNTCPGDTTYTIFF